MKKYILIVSCKLNYIDTVTSPTRTQSGPRSPNNQNYCGVSCQVFELLRTVNERSLGQNDTTWSGQNDTV